MIYGYARVSTSKKDDDGEFVQTTDLQRDALIAAGVTSAHIYEDRISGTARTRPGLDALLSVVQDGDQVVVWKLDRLGRSARDLLDLAGRLKDQGVTIRSLVDGIDTSGALGGFMLTILAAVAELERENIRERVTAGIASSRAAGGRIGRKKAMSPAAREDAVRAVQSGESVSSIARRYRVDRATVYRVLADQVDASGREATSDEAAGLDWWNGLTIDEKRHWLSQTDTETPAEARAAYLATVNQPPSKRR